METSAKRKKTREEKEREVVEREKAVLERRRQEEEQKAQDKLLEENKQEKKAKDGIRNGIKKEEGTRMERNNNQNRLIKQQQIEERERMVYEKRRKEDDERARKRMANGKEDIRESEIEETIITNVKAEHCGPLVRTKLTQSKDKQGADMKSRISKCNAFSSCKEQHSVAQIEEILKQKLDEEIKSKLLESPSYVISSLFHYVAEGGKLNDSILKNIPVEKWVEQSLICDLCKNSSPDCIVTLKGLDEIRHFHGISTTEKILFNLKKYEPLSIDDIEDILTCIKSEICNLENIEESDWLFHLRYNWLKLKFDPTFNEKLIELLAGSQFHLNVLEFLIDKIGTANETEQSYVEEFLMFIQENNIPECDLFYIMKQNASENVASSIKTWLFEVEINFLVKSQSQIDKNNSCLLRTNIVHLVKRYSFHAISKLLDHNFLTNENIHNFIQILYLIMEYQVDETVFGEISANIKQNQSSYWLEHVNSLIVNATFGNKQTYIPTELIDKIMQTSSDYCNYSKISLKAYYDKIKAGYVEPSKLFISEEINCKPINCWQRNELKQWAKHIQERKYSMNEELQLEIIMGIIRGVELHYSITPRDTQILTVCLLLNPKEGRGCLAQVPTGEGKSLIVAMLAIVYGLLRQKVDIITTSTELSVPEANKQSLFFELFNLTVGENSEIISKEEVYKKDIVYGTASNFQADILRSEFQGRPVRGKRGFGVVIVDEVDSMLFDQRTQSTRLSEKLPAMDHLELILANIWSLLNMIRAHLIKKDDTYLFIPGDFKVEDGNINTANGCSEEECGSVVEDPPKFIKDNIEEIINKNLRTLSPDEESKKTQYEKLTAKSAVMCKSLERVQNELNIKIQESSNEKKAKVDKIKNEIEKLKASSNEVEDEKLDNLKNELQKVQEEIEKEVDLNLYREKKLKVEEQLQLEKELSNAAWLKEYPVIEVPNHLLEFARQQVPNWVKSAIDALYYFQRDKHYAVEGGKIVPINYNDTGVFQPDMVWGNGLTQFLQMKEGLQIQPETVATNFLSTHGFFKRYGHQIYGVTGTLGESSTQEFFEKVYGTDQMKIPAHSYRVIKHPAHSDYQCKEFPAKIFPDKESWIEEICKSCLVQLQVNRCVLVICQYVFQVEELARLLIDVHKYPQDKVIKYTGRNEDKFSRTDILPGEIVIATNIAGRGTDLSVNPNAEENGGLHVCITFLPLHFRVELQNVGRTARKGQRGSAQLLLHDLSGSTIQELKQNRSKKEADALKKAQSDVGRIKLQDHLFAKFCNFLGSLFPQLSETHKVKEQIQLEDAYECEMDSLTEESLEKAFNDHVEKLREERVSSLKGDPQHSRSEVDSAMLAIDKDMDLYRRKEYFAWKANHEKEIREAFCTKWKGRVSDDVLECFRLDIPISRGTSLNSSSLDYFDRLSVTEQWGIWVHMTFSGEKIKSEEKIKESFKKYKENIKKQLEEGKIIQNPFYHTKKGNYKLHEKKVDNAIECYEKAIKIDSRRSLYAHINLARAYLTKSSKKEMQLKAKEEYEKALKLIDYSYKPSLLQLHSIVKQTQGGVKTSEHISHQLDILNVVENHADTAIKVINDAQEKNMKVVVTNVESLENIFKDGRDEPEDYSQAVDEVGVNGLTHLATLEARKPTPWWSVVGVTLLGICQIAVGALATIYTAGTLGEGLIGEGVADIIAGIKGAITGSFCWATWAMQKAVSLSVSLICAGFNSIKRNVKAIKDISHSAICFKTGLKLATKQVGMALAKGVGKEVITYVSDLAIEKHVMEKIGAVIEEIVGGGLVEAFEKNELMQRALSIDVASGNNYYQKQFIRQGMILLMEKKDINIVVTYLSRVWRGVLQRKVKNVSVDKLQSIFEEIGNTRDLDKLRETAVKFTKNFLEKYMAQVEKFRSMIEEDEQKKKQQKQETSKENNDNKPQRNQFEQKSTSGNLPQEKNERKFEKTSENKQGFHQEQTSYDKQNFQEQTMPPDSEMNDDNYGIHDVNSGKTYSSTRPQTSSKSSYLPSDVKFLKREFVKPITKNVTDSIRETVVQPLQEMATNSVIDYFSEKTQTSINEQREMYRSQMRSRANNTT